MSPTLGPNNSVRGTLGGRDEETKPVARHWTRSSDRVRHLDVLDLESAVLCEPPAKRLDTEALRRVVSCGHVMDAIFSRLVQHPLGRLTGDVGVETRRHRLVVLAFGGPGDDTDRRDLAPVALENLRLAIGGFRDRREKLIGIHRLGKDAADAGRCPLVFGEGLELGETEAPTEHGGISQIHVSIEGEMVGDQGDVIGQQESNPFAKAPNQPRGFTRVPQETVVDDDGVGPAVDGTGKKRSRGGNGCHHPSHITGTLDLQPVGAVVLDSIDIEELIEIGNELEEIHDQIVPQPELHNPPDRKRKPVTRDREWGCENCGSAFCKCTQRIELGQIVRLNRSDIPPEEEAKVE